MLKCDKMMCFFYDKQQMATFSTDLNTAVSSFTPAGSQLKFYIH